MSGESLVAREVSMRSSSSPQQSLSPALIECAGRGTGREPHQRTAWVTVNVGLSHCSKATELTCIHFIIGLASANSCSTACVNIWGMVQLRMALRQPCVIQRHLHTEHVVRTSMNKDQHVVRINNTANGLGSSLRACMYTSNAS